MNKMITWFMLWAFSFWYVKRETPTGDKCVPEIAPVEVCGVHSNEQVESSEPIYSERFHEGTIMSAGLSELMARRKSRKNMGRRKEDRQAAR